MFEGVQAALEMNMRLVQYDTLRGAVCTGQVELRGFLSPGYSEGAAAFSGSLYRLTSREEKSDVRTILVLLLLL